MIVNRRGLLAGLGAVIVAPAIIPIRNLMSMPRVPYVPMPSGLWVRITNSLTGVDEVFHATATHVPLSPGGLAYVEFMADRAAVFDRAVVGRDVHELLYTDTRNFAPSGRIGLQPGDSVRIAIGLSIN